MVDCMADEIFEHPARLTARIADYEGPWDKSVSVDMRVWWDIRGLWLGDYVRVVLAVAAGLLWGGSKAREAIRRRVALRPDVA